MTEDVTGTLFQQQEVNRRRTIWVVGGFILFFAWLGFGGDYVAYLSTANAPPQTYRHTFPWFGIVLSAVAASFAWYAYRTGPESVLWSTGAREVITPADEKQKQLVNVVEEMAIAAGVPRPHIWIIQDTDPNAFATGIDPSNAHVAVTQGMLDACTRDELQGVVGHEIGHIKNLDVRLMTTLTALVGAVALMHDGSGRLLRSDNRIGSSGGGKSGESLGPLALVLLVVWIISWMLAPIVTQLMVIAVSRKREYLADAMSAQFTRNPLALAEALQKVEAADAPTAAISRGTAHLCICDPLGRRFTDHPGFLGNLLSTHPPMAMRIARLKGMGYAQVK